MNDIIKKKYPLLNLLILIQAGSFFLGAILVFIVIHFSTRSEQESKIAEIKHQIGAIIENRQEEWRAWKYMDMNDALNSEITEVKKTYPIKSIEIDKRSVLSSQSNDGNLIFPKEADSALDLAVMVTIDTRTVSGINYNHKLAIFTTIIFAALFSTMVLGSFFYIRRRIYLPITQMNQALERIASEGTLNVEGINAVGEIKEFIDNFKDMYEKTRESEVHRAIATTLQMLAHDVRKPFSVLKMGLFLLGKVKNMSELNELVGKITPEVDRAMTAVNGMINDVMEIGRTSAPLQESINVESLIEVSLNEVGRMHEGAEVSFSYELNHTHMLFVDQLKVGRVLSNIFANAIQAMKGRGRIWIKTSEADGMIKFCLGNGGSFIPPEDLPRLFDAFFTKNKKGGTGLGLAIAQKAVGAHGGKIWCESSVQQETVEFFFTLPACAEVRGQSAVQLPEDSKSIIEGYKRPLTETASDAMIGESASASSTNISEKDLERMIVAHSQKRGRPLTIAIIDDEAIYRNALLGLIEGAEGLKSIVTVETFSCSQDLLAAFVAKSYDFLICDIDLGRDSLNGYEIVKTLRERGHKTAVCIHSNRSLPEDYKRSVDVGAQAFLPKPLSRFHLFKFMGSLIEREEGHRTSVDDPRAGGFERKKEHVAFLDDDLIFCEFAPQYISDAKVSTYTRPEDFLAAIDSDPTFLEHLDGIITDQNFGVLSALSGLDLGKMLKSKYNFTKPIIVSTNEDFSSAELAGKADLFVPKALRPWQQLKRMIPSAPPEVISATLPRFEQPAVIL